MLPFEVDANRDHTEEERRALVVAVDQQQRSAGLSRPAARAGAAAAAAPASPASASASGAFADTMRAAVRQSALLGPFVLALLLLFAFGRHTSDARSLKDAAQLRAPLDLKAFVAAGCTNQSALSTWSAFRPGFHVSAPFGWINDPHGLFERGGVYHHFFQYNPRAVAWGAPFWAHIVSRDLVRWQWLPPALLPDSAEDINGVWSGAATVDEAGTPWLSYTAASTHVPELGNFYQVQSLASPADLNDPYLKTWRKAAVNPVLTQTPPGGNNFQFRDTTPANTDVRAAVAAALVLRGASRNGTVANSSTTAAPRYAWAVGTQAFCLGTAAIYTAPSLTGPWSFAGNLLNQLKLDNKLNGQCEAPPHPSSAPVNGTKQPLALPQSAGPAYGGPCWQFGSKCRMWEVVDFTTVAPGIYVAKWSDQERRRIPFSTEWYIISDELDPNALRLGPAYNDLTAADTSATDTLLTGRLRGQPYTPQQLDYGSTYASKFERLKDGRIIMTTWVMESFIGCIDSCSDHTAAGEAYLSKAPFKGVLQLPRRVTYNPDTRSLVLFPIEEVKALRSKQVVSIRGAKLPPVLDTPLVLLAESRAPATGGPAAAAANRSRQFHARLTFTVDPPLARGAGGSFNFTVGGRVLMGGNRNYADIVLQGAAAGSSGPAQISSLRLAVDKRHVGGFTPESVEGGPVPRPAPPADSWLLPGKPLTLDIYVDHNIIEVYALEGLARVTSRVYPSDEGAGWGLAAFGSASGDGGVILDADAWSMDNAWSGNSRLC